MPKPILFIKLASGTNAEEHARICRRMDEHSIMEEYYVLITVSKINTDYAMEVLNGAINELQYEELKKIIEDELAGKRNR